MDRHKASQDDLKSHTVCLTIKIQANLLVKFPGHVSGAKADNYIHGGAFMGMKKQGGAELHALFISNEIPFGSTYVLCMYTW